MIKTTKEIRKIVRKQLGFWVARGAPFMDRAYFVPTRTHLRGVIEHAISRIAKRLLGPGGKPEDVPSLWQDQKTDCDNFALYLWSEVQLLNSLDDTPVYQLPFWRIVIDLEGAAHAVCFGVVNNDAETDIWDNPGLYFVEPMNGSEIIYKIKAIKVG